MFSLDLLSPSKLDLGNLLPNLTSRLLLLKMMCGGVVGAKSIVVPSWGRKIGAGIEKKSA